ncbi:MAG: hypothetical protein KDC06_02060 [Chitinophagaceae bacterium]|nr:hypothetical protein [Chitinophagaceae bacterium]
MKRIILVMLVLFSINHIVSAQKDSARKNPGENIKQFWLVILKTGPKDKEIKDSTERSHLFVGHFGNMQKLFEEGVLKVAGPFGKNDFTWRGLFILDCKTKDEAEEYVKTDPTVKAGVFIYDIVPWWADAIGSFAPGKQVFD